ncbi:uncharacterized protein LOC129596435 isoform X2 [Paramacrobiotus metropolitanus]|uniref:uncharacterized protein LOC129596435 isoform X2 n=1 Tax=Paramacrobiotus metropolitanus TaxID=2943436 RepID=UPI002446563A|nr:uncharacterized protein LOC129596435 isoform X2 [Paramacrobiotus metropolitanus]
MAYAKYYDSQCSGCYQNTLRRPCAECLLTAIEDTDGQVFALVSEVVLGNLNAYERLRQRDLWQYVERNPSYHQRVYSAVVQHIKQITLWNHETPPPEPRQMDERRPPQPVTAHRDQRTGSAPLLPRPVQQQQSQTRYADVTRDQRSDSRQSSSSQPEQRQRGGPRISYNPFSGPQFELQMTSEKKPDPKEVMPELDSVENHVKMIMKHMDLSNQRRSAEYHAAITLVVQDFHEFERELDLYAAMRNSHWKTEQPYGRELFYAYADIRQNGLAGYLGLNELSDPISKVDYEKLSQFMYHGKTYYLDILYQWISPFANPAMFLVGCKAASHCLRIWKIARELPEMQWEDPDKFKEIRTFFGRMLAALLGQWNSNRFVYDRKEPARMVRHFRGIGTPLNEIDQKRLYNAAIAREEKLAREIPKPFVRNPFDAIGEHQKNLDRNFKKRGITEISSSQGDGQRSVAPSPTSPDQPPPKKVAEKAPDTSKKKVTLELTLATAAMQNTTLAESNVISDADKMDTSIPAAAESEKTDESTGKPVESEKPPAEPVESEKPAGKTDTDIISDTASKVIEMHSDESVDGIPDAN